MDPLSTSTAEKSFERVTLMPPVVVLRTDALFDLLSAHRYTKIKVNPTFNADKTRLSYTRWVYWNFIPELSVGDPNDFVITTLNPPYLGALAKAGNELLLPVGYSAVIVRELLEFLSGRYWQDSQVWFASTAVNATSTTLITEYAQAHGISESIARLWFLNNWANGTTPSSDPVADAFVLSLATGATAPSGISLSSAEALFNTSDPDSFAAPPSSFLGNAFATWVNASWNTNERLRLAQKFNLQPSQMSTLLDWVRSQALTNNVIIPSLQKTFGFTTMSEMLCQAFGQGTFGVKQSVATLYPWLYPNGPVEYAYWQSYYASGATLTSEMCTKMYLSPPKDLTDALTLGNFLPEIAGVLVSGDFSQITKQWGITTRFEILAITNYYVQTFLNKNPITAQYSIPAIEYWKQHGSGLFANRTAHEWLWNYTDPFAIRMMPTAPPMSFRHNLSTAEFAQQHTRPWTVGTGVKESDELQNTYVWDGFAEVPFYGAPLEVEGATEDGQYAPFVQCKPGKVLHTWIDDYAKDIPLACIDSKSTVLDLKTYTFTPDNTTWQVNPNVLNFVAGFSNISAKYNDSPVFLSNPHFFGAPDYYPKRVIGDASKSELYRDETLVYVEPYTGKVAKFRKGLQANLYLSANTNWFTGSEYENVYKDVMFPVMVGYVHTEVPKDLTKLVTGTVYLALKLKIALLGVFIGLAIIFSISAGAAAIVYYRRRKEQFGYSAIQ